MNIGAKRRSPVPEFQSFSEVPSQLIYCIVAGVIGGMLGGVVFGGKAQIKEA